MHGGAKALMVGVCLSATGCVTDTGKLQVRAIADPAVKLRTSPGDLPQAKALLALGSVGLALEAFRKTLREQPSNAEAMAGIAACYAAMGRYDLERANYELALAYAPNDPALLNALASALERLGENEQAIQVRAEAARLSSVPAAGARSEEVAVTPLSVPRLSSITVKLPPATTVAAPIKRGGETPMAAPQLSSKVARLTPVPAAHAPSEQVATSPLSVPRPPSITVKLPPVTAVASPIKRGGDAPMVAPQPTSATVHLPPPRAVVLKTSNLAQYAVTRTGAPQQVPKPTAPATPKHQPTVLADRLPEARAAQVDMRLEQGPYMKRLSSGEVALITVSPAHSQPQPAMRIVRADGRSTAAPAQPPPRPMLASALRWVPLRYASAASNIVLLNAARSQRLAARTRTALLDRGWRKIGIGNAREVRQRSLVLYSPMRAVTARRLAAELRCKAVRVGGVDKLVVLLGRDAALPKPKPASRA